MRQRREQVERTCARYGSKLKVPLKLYNKKLRSGIIMIKHLIV